METVHSIPTMVTIDPGADGAAVIWEDGEPTQWMFFYHSKRTDYAVMLFDFLNGFGAEKVKVVFLERIFQPYVGTITEGSNLGTLQVLGIPVYRLSSTTWQAYRNKNVDAGWRKIPWRYKTNGKQKSVHLAGSRYPQVSLFRTERVTKPHDGLADALCMGMWVIDKIERNDIVLPEFVREMYQGVLGGE